MFEQNIIVNHQYEYKLKQEEDKMSKNTSSFMRIFLGTKMTKSYNSIQKCAENITFIIM